MSNWKEQIGSHELVEKDVGHEVEKPPRYHVILLNDDYTPMDFVVEILCKFFNKTSDEATDIMLTIHYKGKALCGTYSADIAETKVDNVARYSLEHQHPLKCVLEKA